jgi:hypothetical protein
MAGIDTTSLKTEIAKILSAPTAGAFYFLSAVVVAQVSAGKTMRIPLRQVNSLDVIRTYPSTT